MYSEFREKYPDIQEHWKKTFKVANDIVNWIKERAQLDKKYSKDLKKLASKITFDEDSVGVEPLLCILRDSCQTRASQIRTIAEHFHNDVAYPMKQLLNQQNFIIAEKSTLAKKTMGDIFNLNLKLERYRERYLKSCKLSEDSKGSSKNSGAYKNEHESLKAYYTTIEEYNNTLPNLIDLMKKIIILYQKQEEERYQLMKQTVIQFIQFDKFCSNNIDVDLSEYIPKLEVFKPKHQIEEFARKFARCSFSGIGLRYESQDLYSAGQASHDYLMRDYIDKIWEGNIPDEQENDRFQQQITSTEGRKALANALNSCRSRGRFEIPSESFKYLGNRLSSVLDLMMAEDDFSVAGPFIILSDSFYETNTDPKNFLHGQIIHHPIWKNMKLWLALIEECITNNWNEYLKNSGAEDSSVLRSISVAQLISYAHTMKLFQLDKELILQVIEQFDGKYSLTEDFIDMVKTHLN